MQIQFGVVNKSTILNIFVLHTLQRITHLAVITRKTKIKLGILKGILIIIIINFVIVWAH